MLPIEERGQGMRFSLRALIVSIFVGALAFGVSGLAIAQNAEREAREECVEDVLGLPALDVCKRADGGHNMFLPGMDVLREPVPDKATKALPKTGMHVEDFAAVGAAALAGGAVLLRRMRLSVS